MAVPRTLRGRKGDIKLTDESPRKGGQAEVHRGLDASGRVVAVKIAHEGEDERRGLLGEREALKAIHARVPGGASWLVPILEEGELPDGRPFLVLPWIEHSMQSWLRARQPDLRRRLRAVELTAEAVVQLHRSSSSLAGVVLHRDLKPGNILIEDGEGDLRVLLADLGGAKERTLHHATRNTGIHTPWFAPLEQALPLERPSDPSVDVHALAVVIYTVIVGRPPQAVMSRGGLLTQEAEDLVALHQSGGGRTTAEKARYKELRRAPLERLIELDHAVALPDDDCNRLSQALAHQLGEPGDQAEALAEELTELLVPPLRHALDPNPRQRLSRPETLLGVVTAAREMLPAPPPVVEVVEVATRVSAPVPLAVRQQGRSQGSAGRSPWRWVGALALAAVLLGMCAGVVALPSLWSGLFGVEPAIAEAPPASSALAPAGPKPAGPLATVPMTLAAPNEIAKVTREAPGTAGRPKEQPEPSNPPASKDVADAGLTPEPEPEPVAPPPTPQATAAPATPPRVILSMAPGRGSSPYIWIDGARVAKGEVWQGLMDEETWQIDIRESSEGPRRSFTLSREALDASRWRVTIKDTAGPGSQKDVQVPASGAPDKILVQWCSDNTVRFGCPSSSDP